MQVSVRLKGCRDLKWQRKCPVNMSLGSILSAVCHHFCLSPSTCTLLQRGIPLRTDQKLLKEMKGDTLRLDLAVSPTLAFYTWHSFVQTSLPGVEALTTVWRLLTMSYVKYRDCSITISQQKQLLSDIAAAPPTEVLQSVDLAWKPSMQMPYWFDSPQAIQKPLLFLQLLLLTAHEVACHPAVTSGRGMRPSDDSEMAQVLVIASPHMPKTLTEPNSKWGESSHPVVALRSALLVLKLMTSAVADSTRTLRTLGALWDAVQKIADNLDMHNCGNYPNPIGCQPVGPPLCEEVEEEVHLCRLVTSLLLGLMKQDLKGARSHTTTICALLAAITITKGPASQAVFSELLHTGGLAALVTALGKGRLSAMEVANFLFSRMKKSHMVLEQLAASLTLLGRMQGALHLSRALCPEFSSGDNASFALARSTYGLAWMSIMKGKQRVKLEMLVYLECVAKLVVSVLEAFPLWENTPLQPHVEKDSCSSCTSSFSGSCVYGKAGSWPTPTYEAWRNTQEKVALRALTTLYWLHGKEQILQQQHDSSYKRECTVLKEQLACLLNRLLLGHMSDPRLNMARIVTLGIASLPEMLDSIQPDYRPLTDLTLAFLQRLATDQDVLASVSGSRVDQDDVAWMNQQGTLSIWALFCHRASQRADHTIASTAVEALHAILLSSVLHSKQVLCVPTMVKDFDTAIKGLKGHHTAQLTASACLTQLCITEMEQSTNKRQVLIPHAQCHVSLSNQFATAVQQGAFDTVFDSVREAILVPLPWALEQSVSLTRALWALSRLGLVLPQLLSQHGDEARQLMIRLLAITALLSQVSGFGGLNGQLAMAALAFTGVVSTPASSQDSPEAAQACLTVLTDLMHLLPDDLPAQNPQTQLYMRLGLPARPDRDDLRAALLTAVQGCVSTHMDSQLFGTHGLPLCLNWLVVLASSGMDSYAQGHDILSGSESCRSLVMSCSLLVADYATMLPMNEASDAQTEAAHAMQQLLFLVVHSRAQHHEAQQALAQKKDSSAFPTSAMRHTTSCHSGVAPANAFQLAKEEVHMNLLELTTCLSALVGKMKQMQEGPMALPPSVWAALQPGRWCSEPATMQLLSQHLECMRRSRVLRSDVVNYIQGCLGLQAQPQSVLPGSRNTQQQDSHVQHTPKTNKSNNKHHVGPQHDTHTGRVSPDQLSGGDEDSAQIVTPEQLAIRRCMYDDYDCASSARSMSY